MRETAQRLAERVAGIPGLHGTVRLEWHPAGEWSEGESNHWREILRQEFERRSLNLVENQDASTIEIFAVETPTQMVLTARARVMDRDEIRMVAVARALLPSGSLPAAPLRLERQMIYESAARILDASSAGSGAEEGLAILLYRDFELEALRVDSKGAVKQTVPLNAANLKPSRYPRAELTPRAGSASVKLPGKTCDFSWEFPADVKCHVENPASSDGHEWRGPTLVTSPCDGSIWKLRNPGGEPNAREVLQVVPEGTIGESNAAVRSEFPGPILGANGTQNPGSALVITRNLQTGNYEIYKITLACGN